MSGITFRILGLIYPQNRMKLFGNPITLVSIYKIIVTTNYLFYILYQFFMAFNITKSYDHKKTDLRMFLDLSETFLDDLLCSIIIMQYTLL